jgi:bisanhydrobacterioruberin hydratase
MPQKFDNKLYYLISSMYLAGIIGLSIPSVKPYFQLFTPFHLLAVTYFVFWGNLKTKELYYYIFIITISGYFIEVLGVKTGLIFGEYSYGKTLGIKPLDVPIMIGLNWLVMTYCSTIFSFKILKNKLNKFSLSFLVATLMTLFDLIVEPVAINLDMWSWKNDTPPLQNFVAWFIVSFLFTFFTSDLIKEKINPKAIFILIWQWVFFIALFLSILK